MKSNIWHTLPVHYTPFDFYCQGTFSRLFFFFNSRIQNAFFFSSESKAEIFPSMMEILKISKNTGKIAGSVVKSGYLALLSAFTGKKVSQRTGNKFEIKH